MGNNFCKLLKKPHCINCKVEIDYYNDSANSYLIYIIGKGKYNNKYYCINCFKKLLEKNV